MVFFLLESGRILSFRVYIIPLSAGSYTCFLYVPLQVPFLLEYPPGLSDCSRNLVSEEDKTRDNECPAENVNPWIHIYHPDPSKGHEPMKASGYRFIVRLALRYLFS